MPQVQPFVWFDGSLAEAVDFYASLFPDGTVTSRSEYPPGSPGPEGELMTASVRLGGQDIVFLNGGPQYQLTPAFSLLVTCADQDEIDRFWAAFSEGGETMQCGWVTDRYGLTWQVVPEQLEKLLGDPDPQRAQRATEAMLQMVKLDIAELEAAAAGADR